MLDLKIVCKDEKIRGRNMIDLKIVCKDEKYLPTYANSTDACMDLKVVVEQITKESKNCEVEIENLEKLCFIKPNETVVLGTGIQVAIPEDYVMLVFPRSSTGFKLHCMLSNTTGIIDTGYRDEIKISLTNFGKETVCLKDAQRVAQFMIIPRPKINLVKTQDDEEFRQGDRLGGIGSSGK